MAEELNCQAVRPHSNVIRMADAHFEVFKDASGQFRWRLRAPNGEPIAASEAYTTKEACLDGIKSVQKNAPQAKVKDTA